MADEPPGAPGAASAPSAGGSPAEGGASPPAAPAPRCRWCGRRFAPTPGRGRPRLYCRAGCRQQAHLARKLAAAHGLGPDDLVVSRTALEDLQSRLYCLQAAVEDVDRDLAVSAEPPDVAEALRWLLENARALADAWIEPRVGE